MRLYLSGGERNLMHQRGATWLVPGTPPFLLRVASSSSELSPSCRIFADTVKIVGEGSGGMTVDPLRVIQWARNWDIPINANKPVC